LWIIAAFPALNLNIDDYPSVKKHLESYGKRIHQIGEKGTRKKTGNKWFETQDQIAYHEEFSKEKIVWQRVTKEPMFCLTESNIFIQDSMAFITTDENTSYLMVILNSRLIKLFVEMFVHKYGNTGYLLSNQYVEQLPIPKISKIDQQPFIKLVDKILQAKKNGKDTTILEAEIDELVYKLYNLTADEIKIIEDKD
jgi:hypothetical protein